MTETGSTGRLSAEYSRSELAQGTETERLARRLGLTLTNVLGLERDVLDQLSPEEHGIPWWSPPLDTARRVLVADQLYLGVAAIGENLVEAELSRLAVEDAWEQMRERFRAAIRAGARGITMPTVRAPSDDLPNVREKLATAGVFRALGSVLDCLAAGLIGVCALPLPILRADLGRVRQYRASPAAQGLHFCQQEVLARFEDHVTRVGPDGWLQWTLDMRNTLVHRGRRTELMLPGEIAPQLFVPPSAGADKVRLEALLPREPGRSEVEALRDAQGSTDMMLSEHAGETLTGVVASTAGLVEAVAQDLADLWADRVSGALVLEQPVAQWPSLTPASATNFLGYAPGSVQGGRTATTMAVNPQLGRRFAAAAIMDQTRNLWDTWLAQA
jgi:hypothetical protein